MLLDGCCRADIALLEHFICVQLGRSMQDLKIVVVTHMHPDHAGAAARLRKTYECKIVSASAEQHWYRGISGKLMHLTDIALSFWVAGRLGKPRKNLWYSPYLQPDYPLSDGEAIPGFDEWKVLATPGHTDRDLSVLHLPTRKIYVADLIVKVKKRFVPPFPVFHPNKYKRSIHRIMNDDLNAILLAHGGEVLLNDDDFEYLLNSAPASPKTPWRAIKLKLKRMLLNKR